MIIKTNLADKSNFGSIRDISVIKYIVIHYTANDGDSDESNAKYFKTANRKASAHYFVDSDSITQSVYDNYIAWSVGGSKYSSCQKTGGGKYYGICTNRNSLSIELCDDNKNGVVYPSQKTINNALELVKKKMIEYNIPKSNVIRHFDVVGKLCPEYWCGDSSKNKAWLTDFWNRLDQKMPTLKKGSKGEYVKILQKELNKNGYNLVVDGSFGNNTLNAVIAFQGEAGLQKDGIVGQKTWACLGY